MTPEDHERILMNSLTDIIRDRVADNPDRRRIYDTSPRAHAAIYEAMIAINPSHAVHALIDGLLDACDSERRALDLLADYHKTAPRPPMVVDTLPIRRCPEPRAHPAHTWRNDRRYWCEGAEVP